jgi:Fatty acid cis/trans isomerase (CTI)
MERASSARSEGELERMADSRAIAADSRSHIPPGREVSMIRIFIVGCLFAFLALGCGPQAAPPIVVEPLARPVSFIDDVKPVLDRRCVVCHSCYNAGCQLKLSSYEGIKRGGSKDAVYSSSRLVPQAPSRLFVDATNSGEWRDRGFHSVIENRAVSPANDSILLQMLEAKKRRPQPTGDYHAEAADLTCAADAAEAGAFLSSFPGRGMPFGFPEVDHGEFQILATWLSRGASGPTAIEQAKLVTPTKADAAQIEKWEAFLNADDPKHAVTARYLYEHFFLAHLRFPESKSGDFFELVRSSAPIGEPISVIPTRRPYDDPGVENFYYRFRKIHSTIVHKTHIVVDFSDETLARFNELFIDSEWLSPPTRVAYGDKTGANPFLVFAQIPPRVRYEFLLDHSEYFIRTFIRGPVCKGQVALNVIHDHFWVMFEDPASDETVLHPDFLVEQAENLSLPNELGSDEKIRKAFSDAYRERYAAFYRAKLALYDEMKPDGQGIDAIWRGRRPSDAPLLSIYRHFDSASVHKGALGALPRTLWVIDYSQFERIYYALVAGFDVFGNLSHQVNVRRYMDYLRIEGELNFVRFLPPEDRVPMIRSWYIGEGALADTRSQDLLSDRGTKVEFMTDDPKREFVERVVNEHLFESVGISFDTVNYRQEGEGVPMPKSFETHEQVLDGFRALTVPGTELMKHLTSTDVNVLFVRVRGYEGSDRFISIVINRWHDNVNSLFFEKVRLDPSKDTMEFHSGPIGSYPNYFLDVEAEDIPDFFDMLENFDGSPEYVAKLDKYGVNRSDFGFWDIYDWFQARAFEADPVTAGLFDLNRYYPTALD